MYILGKNFKELPNDTSNSTHKKNDPLPNRTHMPSQCDSEENTALHLAIQNNQYEVRIVILVYALNQTRHVLNMIESSLYQIRHMFRNLMFKYPLALLCSLFTKL